MSDQEPPQKNIPPSTNPAQGNAGSIIGIIIIVLVLALGGLYLWGKRITEKETSAESPDTSLFVPVPGSSVPEMIVGEEDNTNNANH